MDKKQAIKLWEDRIIEINETGNCTNGNPHAPAPYFGEKYTTEEMVKYCNKMLDFIRNNF